MGNWVQKTLPAGQYDLLRGDNLQYVNKSFSGANLVMELYKAGKNLIARGMGMSFSEGYQQTPVMEVGHDSATEVVTGMMQPGQIQFQSIFYFKLTDTMPTFSSISSFRNMTAVIKLVSRYTDLANETPVSGLVTDMFKGVYITGQQGNFNPNSLFLRNASMMYLQRISARNVPANNSGKVIWIWEPAAGEDIVSDPPSGTPPLA